MLLKTAVRPKQVAAGSSKDVRVIVEQSDATVAAPAQQPTYRTV